MNVNKIKLAKNNIILLPNKAQTHGSIIIPDSHYSSSVAKVLKVGPGIHQAIKTGFTVITSSAFSDKKNQIINKDDNSFLCNAKEVFAVVLRNRLYPIGRKVLVRRLVDEQLYHGNIIIPAAQQATDQSLEAVVMHFGLLNNTDHFRVSGIVPGAKIRMRRWESHMIEMMWGDDYCLIINEEDVMCEI